jgi:ketosteroid isomerase-like protein
VETFLAGIRAYNENSVETLLGTYTEEATWHMPGAEVPPVQGRKRVVRQAVAFKTNFPESRFAVKRVLQAGDLLVAQVVFRAVRRFDEQGVEIRPREGGYEGIQLLETERGYARRVLVHSDQVGVRRQLGLAPGDPPPLPAMPEAPEIVRGPAEAGSEEIVARLHGAWEKGDFAAWKELATPDFELVDHATGRKFDLERAVEWLSAEEREADTVLFDRYRTVSAGPWVVSFLARQADWRPETAPEAAPARITLYGAHALRLAGGRVASLELYRNRAEHHREIARVGQPAAAPATADAGPARD